MAAEARVRAERNYVATDAVYWTRQAPLQRPVPNELDAASGRGDQPRSPPRKGLGPTTETQLMEQKLEKAQNLEWP